VSKSREQLPTDVVTLQALVMAMRAERDAAVTERDQALAQNHRLEHLLQQLRRMQFGRRSEKLDREQLHLAFEDVEQAVAAVRATVPAREFSMPTIAENSSDDDISPTNGIQ
jgi:transposase